MIYQHERAEKKLSQQWDGYRPSMPKPDSRLDTHFASYLEWRNLDPELARENGWYASKYKRVPRVIIPCSNADGVPYFQGRDVTETDELRYASPLVPRDDSLVLVWPAGRRARKGCVVLEGPLDALAAAMEGFVGVALMGNTPSSVVLDHLCSFARAFQPVIIVPDADSLDLGPTVLCALAQQGISGVIRAPAKKDLAVMSAKERGRFLHV